MNLRKMERSLDYKKIYICLAANLIVAAVVFDVVYSFTRNPGLTILWTLITWAATITISTGYWIYYLFENVKTDKKTKQWMTAALLALLFVALLFLMSVIWGFHRIIYLF